MPDTAGLDTPGANTVVVRAVFVPDVERPPAEFLGEFHPLKFRATLDRATGIITCDEAGRSFDGDLRAEWHPDAVQGRAARRP